MRQAPVIKKEFWTLALNEKPMIFETHIEVANRALELQYTELAQVTEKERVLAEQATQDQFISADEARALGAGHSEYQYEGSKWDLCGYQHQYSNFVKYRAIRKKVPTEPHADLRALYAQQVKAGTWINHVWAYCDEDGEWIEEYKMPDGSGSGFLWTQEYQYRCTPKPTCQVRNLDADTTKIMTRESAKLLQAETKDVCDWFDPSNDNCEPFPLEFNASGIYTYRSKAKKQVSLDPAIREGVIALLQELHLIK